MFLKGISTSALLLSSHLLLFLTALPPPLKGLHDYVQSSPGPPGAPSLVTSAVLFPCPGAASGPGGEDGATFSGICHCPPRPGWAEQVPPLPPTLAEDEMSLDGHLGFLWKRKEPGKAARDFMVYAAT